MPDMFLPESRSFGKGLFSAADPASSSRTLADFRQEVRRRPFMEMRLWGLHKDIGNAARRFHDVAGTGTGRVQDRIDGIWGRGPYLVITHQPNTLISYAVLS